MHERIKRVAKEHAVSYRAALDIVRKESPEAFRAYMATGGGSVRREGDHVADIAVRIASEQRIDFKAALEIVREEYPEAWKRYVEGGG